MMIPRREWLKMLTAGAVACGAAVQHACSRGWIVSPTSQEIVTQISDIQLTGVYPDDDINRLQDPKILEAIQQVANGSGKEFIIAVYNEQRRIYDFIRLSRAPAEISGSAYAHLRVQINNNPPLHVSLSRAGFLGTTVALQVKNADGAFVDGNGNVVTEDRALSFSIFSGKRVTKPTAAKQLLPSLDSLGNILIKVFGVVLGVFLVATVAKWIIAILAFLASQLLLFIAAAAAIGVVIWLFDQFNISITRESVETFYSRLLEGAAIVFNSIKDFIDRIDFSRFPPQIPEDAF